MRDVKNKIILMAICLLFLVFPLRGQDKMSTAEQDKEYKVKAAFVYNFMKFVEWDGMAIEGFKDKKELTLAIIGDDPFAGGLEALKSKTVAEKPISVCYFKYESLSDPVQAQQLAKCNVVFVSTSEKSHYADIIAKLNSSSVLTIGDEKEFAANSGIISFDIEAGKVCFDINLTIAKKAGVKIDVKLLKLARSVYKD